MFQQVASKNDERQIWSFSRAGILPSLKLLYILDAVNSPLISIKTIGHQWYWSYGYRDFIGFEFDSYIIPSQEITTDTFRLLDVDNRIVLPYNLKIRMLVTSSDVIHSWKIPALHICVTTDSIYITPLEGAPFALLICFARWKRTDLIISNMLTSLSFMS